MQNKSVCTMLLVEHFTFAWFQKIFELLKYPFEFDQHTSKFIFFRLLTETNFAPQGLSPNFWIISSFRCSRSIREPLGNSVMYCNSLLISHIFQGRLHCASIVYFRYVYEVCELFPLHFFLFHQVSITLLSEQWNNGLRKFLVLYYCPFSLGQCFHALFYKGIAKHSSS